MLLQSTHPHADRGLDPYFTPPEAVAALLRIEKGKIPLSIWEPACGNGAIVRPLRQAGHKVAASDIADYGLEHALSGVDYLTAPAMDVMCRPLAVEGIITNPPFRLAQRFAEKAVSEVPYVGLLLRTNFLESVSRLAFFREHPPARIWISSRRLPMMHRAGWEGPRAASNTCFAWIIWDARSACTREIDWFDWKETAQ